MFSVGWVCYGTNMVDLRKTHVVTRIGLYMSLCIEYRQTNSFCSLVHHSYGMPVVVGGIRLGMGWVDFGSKSSPGSGMDWVSYSVGGVDENRPTDNVGC